MASSDPASDWRPTEAASLSSLAECKSRPLDIVFVPLSPAQKQSLACLEDFKRDVAAGRLKGEFAFKQWVAEEHSETFPIPKDCLYWPESLYSAEESSVCAETTPWFVADQGNQTGEVVCVRYRIAYVFLEPCSLIASSQLAGGVSLQDISENSVLPGVNLVTCDWDWIECADGECDLDGAKGVRCLNCCSAMHVRDIFDVRYPKLTSFSYAALDTRHVVYMEKQVRLAAGPAQVKVY